MPPQSDIVNGGSSGETIDYKSIFHWAETQKEGEIPAFYLRENDPYEYQAGFGNDFESEAIPGTLPRGQSAPRKVRFGLYAEQITGSAFVAPRRVQKKAWLYRARPAVTYQNFTEMRERLDIESNFLPSNKGIHLSPAQLAWLPLDIPSERTTFVEGLKTMTGAGDPTLRAGVCTHIYVCNTDMERTAFVNSDGEFLIIPQQGALNIQTEFGMLFVQPGEICVIQRGQRYSVSLPDGPARGYILEIWGSSFELPELGPLGGGGLANVRDFLVPTAKYEVKTDGEWRIVYKLGGRYFSLTQQHSPFDVVAWHGNYVPYKYDLTKFITVGSVSVDHIDPSIFCVLVARGQDSATPLAEFGVIGPRWDVGSWTFRRGYFHRNAASEFMGVIYGGLNGRSDSFVPGAASYECGHVPHGTAYEEYKAVTEQELPPRQISKGTMVFVFESSMPMSITDYAWNSKKKHGHDPKMWDQLVDNFSSYHQEIKVLDKKE
ncbi:hypothetical protein AYL99_08701 [Fonsecaea erecta]|uniref:homogentisate 1,2-dioxygenase n=1 Tax=Fonsecaea erecta TaxID=1367422 RepID=A0A178Z9Z9_9EURO|nr:hypothetical protein AYL99_08701 [Fonsecaea erecta]OAP56589.1 hypothetical protein AYL99_08701 [Fonsecaea erecta]